MASLTPQERLQPALLDRLTDFDPSSKGESVERRVMTKAQLRQAVLRDLAFLLNATRMSGSRDLPGAPLAQRSVINFGMPALAGQTASMLDVLELERAVKDAILAFEPRILADSLSVEAVVVEPQLDHHNIVSVQIRGMLWSNPVPIAVLLRTEVDLESGEVAVQDLGA